MSNVALLCLLAAVPFVLALMSGLIRRVWTREDPAGFAPPGNLGVPDRPLDGAGTDIERIDLSRLLSTLADAARPLARRTGTRIGLAAGPDRVVFANPAMLEAALREILNAAIYGAPGGMVLVSARARGDETYIAVTDDGLAADLTAREAAAQKIARALAASGGSAAVETHREYGTTVTIRLRAPPAPPARCPPLAPRTQVLVPQSA